MTVFILRRLAGFFLMLFCAAGAIFFLLNLLPGDPAALMLGLNAPPEVIAALHRDLGLDQPLLARFGHWLASLAQGDMGMGLTYKVPVAALLLERLHVTLPLALMAFGLTVVFGTGLGCIAALHAHKTGDVLLRLFAQIALSVPNFWAGLVLVLIFAVHLHWFPAGGFAGWEHGVGHGLKSLLLPALALALAQSAILMRVMRASLLEVLSEPYMRTARAKGLSRPAALRRHALRNALLPVVTLLGLQLAFLLTGVVVIENVFALPGVGRLLFQAVSQHDLPVVQNLILVFIALILFVHLAVDLVSLIIDPRLRQSKQI